MIFRTLQKMDFNMNKQIVYFVMYCIKIFTRKYNWGFLSNKSMNKDKLVLHCRIIFTITYSKEILSI